MTQGLLALLWSFLTVLQKSIQDSLILHNLQIWAPTVSICSNFESNDITKLSKVVISTSSYVLDLVTRPTSNVYVLQKSKHF